MFQRTFSNNVHLRGSGATLKLSLCSRSVAMDCCHVEHAWLMMLGAVWVYFETIVGAIWVCCEMMMGGCFWCVDG